MFERPFGSYVMENVLFKISFPAEFHAQTAVECAMQLHPLVKDRLDDVERIEIQTQEAGVRIIDKTGPLANYADRDHRSDEHTSELQSLMRISYAVFSLTK